MSIHIGAFVNVCDIVTSVMTLKLWIRKNTDKLRSSSLTARLDTEILLATLLGRDRSWIHAHPEYILHVSDIHNLDDMIQRRVNGEPVAYITGNKEFYGRDFTVNKSVLVPRPESESFIELLRGLKNDKSIPGFLHQVLDMGTGSGCLAITAKLEFPDLVVTATDTSLSALKVAIDNAKKHDKSIVFRKQSLLAGDKQGYDIVLANLPYVPETMQDKSIMHEPRMALFSGHDGLNHYRKLFEQLEPKHIRFIMTESLLNQHANIEELASQANYTLVKTDGLVQLFAKNDA